MPVLSIFFFFFFKGSAPPRNLPSSPPRPSPDLTAGPMARTVRDAAILLGVLAGADPDDAVTASGPGITDYTKFLDAGGLKSATIGVAPTKLMGYHPGADPLGQQGPGGVRREGAATVGSPGHPPPRGYRRR